MAATVRNVDLTDVKEGGGGNFRPRRKPEGDYKAKVVKADDHTPKDTSKEAGWVLTIQVDGDARSTYPYYLSPAKNQAWKISGVMRACGLNTKAARIKFDPNKLVNRTLGIALVDEEYNGREKSVIDDVFPVSDIQANANEGAPDADEYEDEEEEVVEDTTIEDDEDEDEPEPEPTKPVRRRRKPEPEPEPEDDEDEEEEEEPAPKRRTATPRARKAAPAPEPEDDDEDEDEEEPAPAPRRRRAAPPPAKRRAAPVEDDDDDLDEIELDD